ncbi:conjugative transposon protein TraM [Robiginitalea sediminis]|uniref:conjugative transposon protein TraM n=1 Tax=Robiginitalea sediminis TaxID=1982593 RepID=UPI000B4AE285|nr:conjugative transposon protein TraM [Robiginitalea sediminis]
MNLEKNKIVFAGVLALILLFLVGYSFWILDDTRAEPALTAPGLPNWEGADTPFESKIQALDALKEVRPASELPSPYPDHMIDEKGYFNPDYMEYEKQRIIDSIYAREHFSREAPTLSASEATPTIVSSTGETPKEQVPARTSSDLSLEHQLFFASHPEKADGRYFARARIAGDHLLRKQSRIQIQTLEDVSIGDETLPKNSILWGTVHFGPNRVFISVLHPRDEAQVLEAYDLQDGLRGIYLENSFKAEASREVLEDVVQDVNIAGLPQLTGIKNVFRRRQQNLKVTVLDGHRLLLKSKSK